MGTACGHQTILKLKQDIVDASAASAELRTEIGLANGLPKEEPRRRNQGAALEAMRKGFKTRAETRFVPQGKEARRQHTEEHMAKASCF